jgi:MFS family permease
MSWWTAGFPPNLAAPPAHPDVKAADMDVVSDVKPAVAAPTAPFRPSRSWYVVGLLALLYAISFMDRFMLALLVEPVSREMGLGDAQMGLLLGGGFAAVYAIGGLPIAYILDNNERRRVLVAGVLLWSASTILSAFAGSFASLTVFRAGVALGEAVLTPAAVSLIADLFPREKRGLPISVYAAVSSVMVTGALLINGLALEAASHLAIYYAMPPWRLALILVGLPGVILAILFYLTVAEPKRGAMDEHVAPAAPASDTGAQGGHFLGYLARQWRYYLPFYCTAGCLSMYSFAVVTWIPTLIVRRFGEAPATAGYFLGSVGVPAALLGVFFWPWLANRIDRAGRRDGIMVAYAIAVAIAVPLLVLMPLASSVGTLLAGCFLTIVCTSASGCLVQLAVQAYGPVHMRARLMALALLFINLIGYTVGPLAVALLAEHWAGSRAALAHGMSSLGLGAGLLSLVAVIVGWRAVTRTRLLEDID